jgi:hypothetical protein
LYNIVSHCIIASVHIVLERQDNVRAVLANWTCLSKDPTIYTCILPILIFWVLNILFHVFLHVLFCSRHSANLTQCVTSWKVYERYGTVYLLKTTSDRQDNQVKHLDLLSYLFQNLYPNYRYTLLDVGMVMDSLMGGAFVSCYSKKEFRQKYVALKRVVSVISFSMNKYGYVFNPLSLREDPGKMGP